MLQRWSKLERDFRMKNGRYDMSKIPDIYDCVKYDVIHNATLGLEDTLELFRLSRALADIVIPQVSFRKMGQGSGQRFQIQHRSITYLRRGYDSIFVDVMLKNDSVYVIIVKRPKT